MMIVDAFGFLSYFAIFAGIWLIGKKRRTGWLLKLLGDLGWVGIGLTIGLYSIWMPELCFVLSDAYFYYLWYEESKSEEQGQAVTAAHRQGSSRKIP